MKIGIVILNYNDYQTTLKLVNNICSYSSIDHIVVVDNNSSNNSFNILSEQNCGYTLLKSTENKGYASGNNIGIRYLLDHHNIDILGIVNPDIHFSNEFIYGIKKSFENNPDYAIITGLQMKPNGEISKRAFWQDLDFKRLIISNSPVLSKIDNIVCNYISKKLQTNEALISVPVVEGCCFFINAKDMQKIGLFDENTFLFCEEDILAKKIHKIGKKIGVNKNLKFIHAHSTTIKKALSQLKSTKIMLASKRYLLKNYISTNVLLNILFKITFITCLIEQLFIVYPYNKLKNILK